MFPYLVSGITLAVLAALIEWQRRVQRRERPLVVWDRAYEGAEAAVRDLEAATGLARVRQSDGWGWLANIVFVPVWFIWGDLRARRPERQLLRWRLDGERTSGRRAHIALDADHAKLAVACRSSGLWADRERPLEQQEGLRLLGERGEARWMEGAALLRVAFVLGVDHLRTADGYLEAVTPLSAAGPAQGAALLAALEALATFSEDNS